MEEFEELRKYPEAFGEFLEDYVSAVVGKNDFRRKSKQMLLSSFVTISDEAFALLTVKNNEEVWPVKYYNSNLREGETPLEEPKPRYTNRRRTTGSARDGWTPEGMKQFITYYKMVAENRKSVEGLEFEKEYLEENKKSNTRKTIVFEPDESDGPREESYSIPNDWNDDVENVEKALMDMEDERRG